MDISRIWAMPSKHTFTIKPIKELLNKYIPTRVHWVDPFAGYNSPANITNDIDPESPAKHHMHAVDFLDCIDYIPNCLVDPPYSPRQISECYKSIGRKVTAVDTQNAKLYADVKNKICDKMPKDGMAISFGWNSGGMGKKRGYEMIEILLVCHGSAHNDTIVVVEKKIK